VTLQASDCGEHIFDIAMAPVVAFDLGDGRDVTSSKCRNLRREQHYDRYRDQQHVL
jgi:hypothetical protein